MQKIYKKTGLLSVVMASIFSMGLSAYAASFTLSDVAQHSTASNCWLIINNNVYSVTSFIPLHEGGQSVVINACGTNATAVFDNGPHSNSMLNSLAPFIVGTFATATPVLTNVTIVPMTSSIPVGGTSALSVSPLDQNNNSIVATTSFISNNPLIATVNASGTVTGVSMGTTTITVTATNGTTSVTGTAFVTIIPASSTPVLTSLVVAPMTKRITLPGSQQLTIVTKDQFGATISASTTFSSSNTSIATVSATGLVTGVARGTAVITATATNGAVTLHEISTITVVSHRSHDDEDEHGNRDDDHEHENDHESNEHRRHDNKHEGNDGHRNDKKNFTRED
jgi:hypothetical protein